MRGNFQISIRFILPRRKQLANTMPLCELASKMLIRTDVGGGWLGGRPGWLRGGLVSQKMLESFRETTIRPVLLFQSEI